MHRRARRIEPVLGEVEPVLATEEVAYFGEAHGVVGRQGVEQPGFDRGKGQREDDGAPRKDKNNVRIYPDPGRGNRNLLDAGKGHRNLARPSWQCWIVVLLILAEKRRASGL